MSMRLNRAAYEQLITQDLEQLAALPDTLERHHIEHVLWWSIDALYGPLPPVVVPEPNPGHASITAPPAQAQRQ